MDAEGVVAVLRISSSEFWVRPRFRSSPFTSLEITHEKRSRIRSSLMRLRRHYRARRRRRGCLGHDRLSAPSPNLTLCYGDDNYLTTDCTQFRDAICSQYHLANVNQFPAGSVTATKGTTTQVAADCWQRNVCVWNPNGGPNGRGQCQASQTWGAWNLADKTVVGTAQCPTNEG